MSASCVVKFVRPNGANRRLEFIGTARPGWEQLSTRVAPLYNIPLQSFGLTYPDEEKDEITISTEEELQLYYATQRHPNGHYKFTVVNISEINDPSSESSSDEYEMVTDPPSGERAEHRRRGPHRHGRHGHGHRHRHHGHGHFDHHAPPFPPPFFGFGGGPFPGAPPAHGPHPDRMEAFRRMRNAIPVDGQGQFGSASRSEPSGAGGAAHSPSNAPSARGGPTPPPGSGPADAYPPGFSPYDPYMYMGFHGHHPHSRRSGHHHGHGHGGHRSRREMASESEDV